MVDVAGCDHTNLSVCPPLEEARNAWSAPNPSRLGFETFRISHLIPLLCVVYNLNSIPEVENSNYAKFYFPHLGHREMSSALGTMHKGCPQIMRDFGTPPCLPWCSKHDRRSSRRFIACNSVWTSFLDGPILQKG